jgi:voltage-gated potassium channel
MSNGDADARAAPATVSGTVVAWSLLRALLSMVALLAVYFLGPLDGLRGVPLGISLAVAAALVVGIGTWQVRAITASSHPGLRGVEALAITVPLYILVFAGAYYAMSLQDAASFDVAGLTRMDTLYFAVTVFSSVGFGDISAASQAARVLVTVQMILNLLVLGAGIRVFVGAVQRTRESRAAA